MNSSETNTMMTSPKSISTKAMGLTTLLQILKRNKVFVPSEFAQKATAYALVFAIFIALIINASDNPRYDLVLSETNMLLSALVTTLCISLITLFLSLLFGFVFFLAMRSKNTFIKTFTNSIKEIVMGTPLLVMIFLVVYVFGIEIGLSNKLVLGIIALTAYMTPYIANAYETASSVIGKDQYVVMDLYHFNLYQRYRYIILPQMIKPLVPSMLNNLSSIIKGSALLKIVSVTEISYIITVISNKNYTSIEGYIVMWVMYLIVTMPLSLLSSYLGRRFGSEN